MALAEAAEHLSRGFGCDAGATERVEEQLRDVSSILCELGLIRKLKRWAAWQSGSLFYSAV